MRKRIDWLTVEAWSIGLLMAIAALQAVPVNGQEASPSVERAWVECVLGAAQQLGATSEERADIIAEAALGSCIASENAVEQSLGPMLDYDIGDTRETMADLRGRLRRQALAIVVKLRASGG